MWLSVSSPPPTSVQSEQLFSLMGHILRPHLSCMNLAFLKVSILLLGYPFLDLGSKDAGPCLPPPLFLSVIWHVAHGLCSQCLGGRMAASAWVGRLDPYNSVSIHLLMKYLPYIPSSQKHLPHTPSTPPKKYSVTRGK